MTFTFTFTNTSIYKYLYIYIYWYWVKLDGYFGVGTWWRWRCYTYIIITYGYVVSECVTLGALLVAPDAYKRVNTYIHIIYIYINEYRVLVYTYTHTYIHMYICTVSLNNNYVQNRTETNLKIILSIEDETIFYIVYLYRQNKQVSWQ